MSLLTDELLWEAYLEYGDEATLQNIVPYFYMKFHQDEITIEEIHDAINKFANEYDLSIPNENDEENEAIKAPEKSKRQKATSPTSSVKLTDELMWTTYLQFGDAATIQNISDHLYALFDEGEITIDEIRDAITRFANDQDLVIPDEDEIVIKTPTKSKSKNLYLSSAEGAVWRSPSWKPKESTAERFKSPSGRSKYVPKRLLFEAERSTKATKTPKRKASGSPRRSRAASASPRRSRTASRSSLRSRSASRSPRLKRVARNRSSRRSATASKTTKRTASMSPWRIQAASGLPQSKRVARSRSPQRSETASKTMKRAASRSPWRIEAASASPRRSKTARRSSLRSRAASGSPQSERVARSRSRQRSKK